MKKFFYIIIFTLGLQASSNAQVKHIAAEAVKAVKFYPNPASSFINFEFSDNYNDSYTIVIFNFIGKKVEDLKVTDQKITVSLANFEGSTHPFSGAMENCTG